MRIYACGSADSRIAGSEFPDASLFMEMEKTVDKTEVNVYANFMTFEPRK